MTTESLVELTLIREEAEREFYRTLQVLSEIPEASLDLVEPETGSSIRDLAWEFVTGERRAHEMLWHARPGRAGTPPATLEDILDAYDRVRDAWLRRLDELPTRDLGGRPRRTELLWALLEACAVRRERFTRLLESTLPACAPLVPLRIRLA